MSEPKADGVRRVFADIFPPDRPKPNLRVATGKPKVATLNSAKASSYIMRGITWFWPNRLSIGKLGLIGGLPEKAKG